MNFNAGGKDERRGLWHTSLPPKRENMSNAHKWCKEQESSGRFYYHYTNTRWWFENAEDATFFTLIWGNR